MRCATLTQPWCGLMAAGIKAPENRERPIIKRDAIGSQIALHASREIDESVYARIAEIAPDACPEAFVTFDPDVLVPAAMQWYRLSRITSAVLCVGTLDRIIVATGVDPNGRYTYAQADLDAIGDQQRWLFGRYAYVLRDVIALPAPVRCKGSLGFWTLDAETERRVLEQIGEAL